MDKATKLRQTIKELQAVADSLRMEIASIQDKIRAPIPDTVDKQEQLYYRECARELSHALVLVLQDIEDAKTDLLRIHLL